MDAGEFRFGEFTVDAITGVLHRHGVRVPLQAQPARLLLFLIRRPAEIVTREEIRAHVWGDTVVAFDQNINYCVRQIRLSLGEGGASLVQTVPKQGYRFTGTPIFAARSSKRRLVRFWPIGLGIPAALVVFLAGYVYGVAIHEQPEHPWRFVYAHITGEAHCPYSRFLIIPRGLPHRT
jgi:DNA-binding winged helix-turn-helix (wHTH) protein